MTYGVNHGQSEAQEKVNFMANRATGLTIADALDDSISLANPKPKGETKDRRDSCRAHRR
jgi:hypothetical protein